MTERFEYKFKLVGGSLSHCTYCPKPPGESCPLKCADEYEKLEAERKADGVRVVDILPEA